jgi:hypothetical protein
MVILVLLCVHVIIGLSLTFFPGIRLPGSSKVVRIYQYLVHLGPFYREEAIQTSPHFQVIVNGKTTDLIQAHFEEYRSHPWKMNELTLRDHVRRSADSFHHSRKQQGTASFRRLSRATEAVLPKISADDSVTWVYFHRRAFPQLHAFRADTVFVYHFKWQADE